MKLGKKFVVGSVLASALALPGCASTLFFPVKPAEKAVDMVIDDVWSGLNQATSPKADAKK